LTAYINIIVYSLSKKKPDA